MLKSEVIKLFKKMDPEAAKKITPLKEHPEIKAANEKMADLQDKLAVINEQCRSLDKQVDPGTNLNSDAQELLDGGELGDISKPTSSTKQELFYQKETLIKAIELHRQHCVTLEARIISELCDKHSDIVIKYVTRTISAVKELKAALEEQEIVFAAMSQLGLAAGLRPGYQQFWPAEHDLLSRYHGGMSLEDYLKRRLEGLPKKNLPKKE